MFIFRRIGSKINKIAMESTNKFANSINSINSINRTILTTPIELENKKRLGEMLMRFGKMNIISKNGSSATINFYGGCGS